MLSGTLFVVKMALDLAAGPPPSNGIAILVWMASGRLALVEMEDGLVVGVVVERHATGWVTVFAPGTPAPASGAVYLFPQAKVHALVIPKRAYVSAQDFGEKASDKEIAALQRAISKIAAELGVDKTGYRLIANSGAHGHQEVPHYHVHILGGQPMGKMVNLP